MYNGSYWRGYFMARHHVSLVIGIVLEAGALISTLTGKTFVKYQGISFPRKGPEDVSGQRRFLLLVWIFLLDSLLLHVQLTIAGS